MKKKIIISIISLLIIGIIVAILFIFNFFKPVTTVITLSNNLTFQYDDEVFLYDTISIVDGNILDENYLINTDELGKHEIELTYKDSNRWKHKYKYEYEVIDKIAPLLSISKNLYVGVGNKDDEVLKNAFWGDNCDREVEVKIEGEYDLDEIGDYPVTIVAVDDSNNTTTYNSIIHVYQPIINNDTNNNDNKKNISNGIDVNYYINNYKTDDVSIGLDLSEFQEVTDFNAIKNAGIDFVMLRIGFGPKADLSFVKDNRFEEYYKGAKEAGLKIGAYYFSYANKLEEVDLETNFVLESLKDKEIDLWVSYDWENWNQFKNAHMSFTDLNKMAKKFIKTMNDNGYKGMNYGSKSYLDEIWNLKGIDTWLAHYNNETSYSKPFKIWQITDKGKVPGITNLVDIDLMFK